MDLHQVTLYGKKECCLCDEAKVALNNVRRRVPFRLEVVDIESDPALMEAYGLSIPVVTVDGVRVFMYRVNEPRLLAILSSPPGERK